MFYFPIIYIYIKRVNYDNFKHLQLGRLIKTHGSVTPFARITSKIKCTSALVISIHALFTFFCSVFALKVCHVVCHVKTKKSKRNGVP